MPESIFLVISSIATFATVWVWMTLLLVQFAARRKMLPEESAAPGTGQPADASSPEAVRAART
ncbi:hypothetical protein AB0K23_34735 [Streptomyces sp. NPDC049602]|uniref:hypothetical protein n=1 Tax=Streptomyces sp. NPDC049602 TaxID=3155504 RepID=UPI003445A5F0